MKYRFNFENRNQPVHFNRERLLLSAMQDPEQLYYMMDTQYEGIYQAEALERRRQYGENSYSSVLHASKFKLFPHRRQMILSAFEMLEKQQTAVFRRGTHFYTEVPFEEIVPGDVIFLSKGDVIPADLRIIFSKELVVNQGIYPDSEVRVLKNPVYGPDQLMPEVLTEIPNICFVGTTVVEGLARGIVINTGKSTYLSHLLMV